MNADAALLQRGPTSELGEVGRAVSRYATGVAATAQDVIQPTPLPPCLQVPPSCRVLQRGERPGRAAASTTGARNGRRGAGIARISTVASACSGMASLARMLMVEPAVSAMAYATGDAAGRPRCHWHRHEPGSVLCAD
jgi:hypothetical protein